MDCDRGGEVMLGIVPAFLLSSLVSYAESNEARLLDVRARRSSSPSA